MRKKKLVTLGLVVAMTVSSFTACGSSQEVQNASSDASGNEQSGVSTEKLTVDYNNITASISFSEDGASVDGSGAEAKKGKVTITEAGTYEISGECSDARIKIETEDENAEVILILAGCNLTNTENEVIINKTAATLTVALAEGSENVITCGTEDMLAAAKEGSEDTIEAAETASTESGDLFLPLGSEETVTDNGETQEVELTYNGSAESADAVTEEQENEDAAEEEGSSIHAAIYSKTALNLTGSGLLTVNGYANNGIQSKGALLVEADNVTITAANDGIKGKESVTLNLGSLTVNSVGDAIVSDGDLTVIDGIFDIRTGDGAEAKSGDGFGMGGGSGDPSGDRQNAERPESSGENSQEPPAGAPDMNNGEAPAGAPDMNNQEAPTGAPDMNNQEAPTGAPDMNNTQETPVAAADANNDEAASVATVDTNHAETVDVATAGDTLDEADVQTFGQNADESMDAETADSIVDSEGSSVAAGPQGGPQMGGGPGMMQGMDQDNDENAISCKAFKAGANLTVEAGTFTIDAADDGLHAAEELTINGGTFFIASSDDGMHSDNYLTINQGEITISECYEGIEGIVITINDGNISVTSNDDGLNASGGSSNMFGFMGGWNQNQSTTASGDEEESLDPLITINGGTLYVDAEGDGLDSNKDLYINGGDIYVDGPSNGGNSAIDIGSESQGIAVITGGNLVAIGYSSMAEKFESDSTQCSFLYGFDSTVAADTEVTITDESGQVISTFTTKKACDCINFSSADLVDGQTYTITAGSQTGTITLSGTSTSNVTGGMMGFGGR